MAPLQCKRIIFTDGGSLPPPLFSFAVILQLENWMVVNPYTSGKLLRPKVCQHEVVMNYSRAANITNNDL